LPVYYSLNGKIVAECESGRKMVIDVINGQIIEKGEVKG
jgi:ketopantoate reductase